MKSTVWNASKGVLEKRFSDAWQKLFHGTLEDNEALFADELHAGAKACHGSYRLRLAATQGAIDCPVGGASYGF